jgi:hypothetical protein
LGPSGRRFVKALSPYFVDLLEISRNADKFDTAPMTYVFDYSQPAVELLLATTQRLFDWSGSGIPQGLEVDGPQGEGILYSLASRQEAWIRMDEVAFDQWLESAPADVKFLLRSDLPFKGRVTPMGVFGSSRTDAALFRRDITSVAQMLPADPHDHVAQYLRSGVVAYAGGATEDVLGNQFRTERGGDLLTDGVYFWWRDAADYVDAYRVGLPEIALTHMQDNEWVVPVVSDDLASEISRYILHWYRD